MPTDPLRNKTVIGADCHIRGEMWLDNDLVVLGQVEGNLQVAGVLEMPAGAQVQGEVVCKQLHLAGRIEGEVVAEEAVELLDGAYLSGRLYTPRLMMQGQATLEASVCVGPTALDKARQWQEMPLPAEAATPTPASVPPTPVAPPVLNVERPATPVSVAGSDAPVQAGAALFPALDPTRPEPVVSTVQTVPQTLRGSLERPRLPRIIKGGVAGAATTAARADAATPTPVAPEAATNPTARQVPLPRTPAA